jgi:hypothetical protein
VHSAVSDDQITVSLRGVGAIEVWGVQKHPVLIRYPQIVRPMLHCHFLNVPLFPMFRLQRHFCVFAISFPDADALKTIYSSIFTAHLELGDFHPVVKRYGANIVEASLELHRCASRGQRNLLF